MDVGVDLVRRRGSEPVSTDGPVRSAVGGLPDIDATHDGDVGVGRTRIDAEVVPALSIARSASGGVAEEVGGGAGHRAPRLSRIIGAEKAQHGTVGARRGDHVDAVGVGRGHGDGVPLHAGGFCRQGAGGPAGTTVRALPEGAGAGGIDGVGVAGLEFNVAETRAGRARGIGPGRARIGGTQDAVTRCGHEDIAVGRRDEDPRNGIGGLGRCVHLRPIDAAIGGLHDAESIGVESIVIPGRRIEDVAVVVVDGDVRESDGGNLVGLIRIQEVPIGAGIGGLPDATSRCATEIDIGVVGIDADLVDPADTTRVGVRSFRWTGDRSEGLPHRRTHRRCGRSWGINPAGVVHHVVGRKLPRGVDQRLRVVDPAHERLVAAALGDFPALPIGIEGGLDVVEVGIGVVPQGEVGVLGEALRGFIDLLLRKGFMQGGKTTQEEEHGLEAEGGLVRKAHRTTFDLSVK